MKALTVLPGQADSLALGEVEEPGPSDGDVLVEVVSVGVCGTDMEIISGEYGQAPPGQDRLVLGHENLGRVLQAPDASGLHAGDLVVCIVRRPDPVPCVNCAAGQWDMCRNGRYTEHGISGVDGFMRERYRAPAERLVPVPTDLGLTGVLTEPTTIVAKAWDQVAHAADRMAYQPRTALITGAGPVGLLAALLGVQRGYQVHVLDRVTDGPKPQLVADLGATYHSQPLDQLDLAPDVVIECTGVPAVVLAAIACTGQDGISCLTGVSSVGEQSEVDVGQLNRSLVLQNDVIVGSVNANRSHYEAAVKALVTADRGWLQRLVTRTVSLQDYPDAFSRRSDDVKVVLGVGRLP